MILVIAYCIGSVCSEARVGVPSLTAADCAIPYAPHRLAQTWVAEHGGRLVRARCADASEADL